MSASESHIRALVEALAQRDQRIATLEQQVATITDTSRRLRCTLYTGLAQRGQRIAAMTQQLAALEQQVAALAPSGPRRQTLAPSGPRRQALAASPIRDMAIAFTDGQMIAHPLELKHDGQPNLATAWIGTYCADRNVILRDGMVYVSLDAFVTAHAEGSVGWRDCFYCDMNGDWVTTARIGC